MHIYEVHSTATSETGRKVKQLLIFNYKYNPPCTAYNDDDDDSGGDILSIF